MLNESQIEAVNALNGYVRVMAGAGSGKTSTLTERYLKLIELGVPPKNILCVTFTSKAAGNMRRKIRKKTEIKDKDLGYICTFHGLCHRILTNKETYNDILINAGTLKLPIDYAIADSTVQRQIIKDAIKRLNIPIEKFDINKLRDTIHKLKGEQFDLYAEAMTSGTAITMEKYLSETESIFWMYMNICRERNALDYDDLLLLTLLLFQVNPDALEYWQKKFQFIMVDEFQDVNDVQCELIDIISKYHKNLFVVGDGNQSIYSFRGSKIERIMQFDKEYESCQDVFLQTNYRSTEEILDTANTLIEYNEVNTGLVLKSVNGNGQKPKYLHTKSDKIMNEWVIDVINDIHDRGADYKDIAVLFRSNRLGESLYNTLTEKNVPAALRSGTSFYQRKEIQDALAYLKLAFDQADDMSFMRICNAPRRGLGKQSLKKIEDTAALKNISCFEALEYLLVNKDIKNQDAQEFVDLIHRFYEKTGEVTVSELLKSLLAESRYFNSTENTLGVDEAGRLGALIASSYEWSMCSDDPCDLRMYLNDIAIYTEDDIESDLVSLMTVHAAKGLEFPYVIIYELSEGVFPSSSTMTTEAMEEERRLCYVAVTRAEKELYICSSEGFTYGSGNRYPSRFVFEMEDTIDYVEELDEEFIEVTKKHIAQKDMVIKNMERMKPGTRVLSQLYGEGTVLGIEDSHIKILFDKKGEIELTLIAKLDVIEEVEGSDCQEP